MIRLQAGVALVEVVRSGVVESVHSGHVVVLGADGSELLRLGDPDQPVFPRSALKPLQATGMVRLGCPVDGPELALAAASHSGEPAHLAGVRRMLQAAELSEDDLGCPPDWPLDDDAWRAAAGPARLAMNCSGKHAAMLLTCRTRGWPLGDYLSPDHALQRSLRDTVAELTGSPVVSTGVDGCGAPVFAVSLTGLARAFGRLAAAAAGAERQVADAMRGHPFLVGGSGRAATLLMSSVTGLIAKDGAEGVFAAALPDGGAVAVKVDSGAARAADRAVVAGLRRLVDAAALADLAAVPVLGGGQPVGEIRPVF